jgi:hypothetical protein
MLDIEVQNCGPDVGRVVWVVRVSVIRVFRMSERLSASELPAKSKETREITQSTQITIDAVRGQI